MRHKELNNEKELLFAISSGDEGAFQQLFDHYHPVIYTLSLRLLREAWVAEEVVQDVFLKVWLKRDILPEIENFGGWIYKISSNLTRNAIKRAHREQQQIEHWLEYSPLEQEAGLLTAPPESFEWLLLEKAIERLPPKQQETFRLLKEKQMKREDAAKLLMVSPETIKSNMDMALRSIRAFCITQLEKSPVLITIIHICGFL